MQIICKDGEYSQYVTKSNGILKFKGSIDSTFSCDIQVWITRIALNGFKSLYYPYPDGDLCYAFGSASPKDMHTSIFHDDPETDKIHFDALVGHDEHIPYRNLNIGGPHAQFVDYQKLGLCGVLNEYIPIFLPRNLTTRNPTSDEKAENQPPCTTPYAPKSSLDADALPHYEIIPRETVIAAKNGANVDHYLVPVKIKAQDDRFAGFIPASYILYGDAYREVIRKALTS